MASPAQVSKRVTAEGYRATRTAAERRIVDDMCRNITPLRGLDPPATAEEVVSAARQYVRKVASVTTPGQMASPAIEAAIDRVAAATADLLAELPPRRQPPKVVPPLRRRSPRAGDAATG